MKSTVDVADHSNNLAGSIAVAFLLVLYASSSYWVRRAYYQVTSHLKAEKLQMMILVCLHCITEKYGDKASCVYGIAKLPTIP